MSHPYRHPAPRPDLTARPWSVTEWQKVVVRALQWLPWTDACHRWHVVQRRRMQAFYRLPSDPLNFKRALAAYRNHRYDQR